MGLDVKLATNLTAAERDALYRSHLVVHVGMGE